MGNGELYILTNIVWFVMMKAKKYTELYIDELDQVIHPVAALCIINSGRKLTDIKILGLTKFLSPFCNGEVGKQKLLNDITTGDVVILEGEKAFHGILDSNGMVSLLLSSSFRSKMQYVQAQGKMRPQYGFQFTNEIVDTGYSSEPIVPEVIGEDTPKTEFLLGWMLVEKGQRKDEIFKKLLPAKVQVDKRDFLSRHNRHLNDYVRKGEIVVIPTTDPIRQEDVEKLEKVKAEAFAAHTGIYSLSEEASDALNNHFYGFDYSVANKKKSDGTFLDSAGKMQTWGGALNNRVASVFKELQESLDRLDSAYRKAAPEIVENKKLPESLKAVRTEVFHNLQRPLDKLALKASGIKVYPKVKHTLGLSTKSIIHNADELFEGGGVRALGKRTETIAKSATKIEGSGRWFLGLDIALSVPKVYTAATTGEDVKRVVVAESARVAGGYYIGIFCEAIIAGVLGAVGVSSSVVTFPIIFAAGGVGALYGSEGAHDFMEVVYDGKLEAFWDECLDALNQ